MAVLLTAILVVLLTGQQHLQPTLAGMAAGSTTSSTARSTLRAESTTIRTKSSFRSRQAFRRTSIQKIKIDWVAGNVELFALAPAVRLRFSESSYRNLTERQKMRYSVSNGRHAEDQLSAKIWTASLTGSIWMQTYPRRSLVMEVPATLIGSLQGYRTSTVVSASVDLSSVYTERKPDIETVSGGINCTEVSVDQAGSLALRAAPSSAKTRRRRSWIWTTSAAASAPKASLPRSTRRAVSGSTQA